MPLQNCQKPSCKCWHPPVDENYKSETGCTCGGKCFFRHVEAEEKTSRKSKKDGAKGSVALLKESARLGCVSQDSYPRNSILRERGKLGPTPRAPGTTKKFGKERVHREELFKSVNLMSAIRVQDTTLQERCARRVAWDLAQSVYKH